MQTIRLSTWIDAPVERCFKLLLSVDLREKLMAKSRETAEDGVTSGLMGPGDRVVWRGWHLGWRRRHEALIDVWRPYTYFREVRVSGAFEVFEHEHHLAPFNGGTRLRDEVRFAAPMGVAGRMVERLVLRDYLTELLRQRNAGLRRVAQGEGWKEYLKGAAEIPMAPYRHGERTGAMLVQ